VNAGDGQRSDHEQASGPSADATADEGLVKRVSSRVDRQKERAQEILKEAESRRPKSALLDVGFTAYEHDGLVGGGVLAGAVAFRIFLFVVPLVFVFVSGFGLAADAANRTPSDLAASAGILGLMASMVKTVDDQSFGTRLTIFLVGGFALVIAARTLMLVLNAVFVLVWRLPRTKIRRKLRAVSGLLLIVLLGALMVRLLAWFDDQSVVVAMAGTVVSLALVMVGWTWASLRVFPHPPELLASDVLPGAVLVAFGVEAMRLFTVIYVSRSFEHKSQTYGAVGGSLALLLWAYVLGRILIGSAVLNAACWQHKQRMLRHWSPPAMPQPSAPVANGPDMPQPAAPVANGPDMPQPSAPVANGPLPPPPPPPLPSPPPPSASVVSESRSARRG
jgi:uncharacterized BrkB/YihY/UPF0761 family membrane protein